MSVSNYRTTDPVEAVVSLTEMDAFLRGNGVLESEDSDLIEALILAATEYAEQYTRRAFISQTWTMFLDSFPQVDSQLGWWDGVREGSMTEGPANFITLPIGPLQSVTSLSTFNNSNEETVMDSNDYYLNTASTPGEIILNAGVTWPVNVRISSGVKVVYVCGYGDLSTDVPSALRTAVKMIVTHWYENREYTKTQSDMNQASSPIHVQSILDRYRVVKL